MFLGIEPEEILPGRSLNQDGSEQEEVSIADGCGISSGELQTVKDKMAALTAYYRLSHVTRSKTLPDTSSKIPGKTVKTYNLKAKCQKCFVEVSFWNNTAWNLVSHYKTKHNHDLLNLKAAISSTSRRGLKNSSGNDHSQRHDISLSDSFYSSSIFTEENPTNYTEEQRGDFEDLESACVEPPQVGQDEAECSTPSNGKKRKLESDILLQSLAKRRAESGNIVEQDFTKGYQQPLTARAVFANYVRDSLMTMPKAKYRAARSTINCLLSDMMEDSEDSDGCELL